MGCFTFQIIISNHKTSFKKFYVLSFFKKGDTIQGGGRTLFKGGRYLRKYGMWLFLKNRNHREKLHSYLDIFQLALETIDQCAYYRTVFNNIEIHSALLAHLSCRLNSTAELSSSAYRQPVAPAELRSGDRDES